MLVRSLFVALVDYLPIRGSMRLRIRQHASTSLCRRLGLVGTDVLVDGEDLHL